MSGATGSAYGKGIISYRKNVLARQNVCFAHVRKNDEGLFLRWAVETQLWLDMSAKQAIKSCAAILKTQLAGTDCSPMTSDHRSENRLDKATIKNEARVNKLPVTQSNCNHHLTSVLLVLRYSDIHTHI